MERVRFDAMTQLLGREQSRRAALGLLAGALGITAVPIRDLAAKKKKNKKKGKRCLTVGNAQVTCPKDHVCCDPTVSTGPGCAPADSPICCLSTGFAHEAGIVCCATSAEGSGGICDTTHPHCCPPGIYGCCEAGFPVCCSDPTGPYCCPAGMTCCATSPSGCCAVGAAAPARDLPGVRQGKWLPTVPTRVDPAAYVPFE